MWTLCYWRETEVLLLVDYLMLLKWNCIFIFLFFFWTRHCLAQCTCSSAHPSYRPVIFPVARKRVQFQFLFIPCKQGVSLLYIVACRSIRGWSPITEALFDHSSPVSRACHLNTPAKEKKTTAPKDSPAHKHPGVFSTHSIQTTTTSELHSESHNSAWALIFFLIFCFILCGRSPPYAAQVAGVNSRRDDVNTKEHSLTQL